MLSTGKMRMTGTLGVRHASGGTYDLAVIGGGPGGYVASLRAAKLGMKVVCVEKQPRLGGTCLNVGCIPSKCLLHATELYETARDARALARAGVEQPAALARQTRMNVSKMQGYKEGVIAGLSGGIAQLFKKARVDLVRAHASLTERPGEIALDCSSDGKNKEGTQTLHAKNIILAAGSVPVELPFARFDEERVLSSTGALGLRAVPRRMVIIGAGIIGLELGTVWSRLGADVTVVEFLDRVAPGTDGAVARHVQRMLQRQGLKFHLRTKVARVERRRDGVTVHARDTGAARDLRLDADCVLVCVGRRPATAGLGLERAGVRLQRGRVVTDAHYRTGVRGVYAIGDLVDGPMLAHKAEEEGLAVADAVARGTLAPRVRFDTVPGVLYTKPEVAWVGMTTEAARARGIAVATGQYPVRANGRARSIDAADGFAKVVTDKKTHRLLGVHIVGPDAGEMIAGCTLALERGCTAEQLASSVFPHPTVSEVIKEAAAASINSGYH